MGTELLPSLSGHSKRSSHGKDEFLSVTVRKDDPSQKAGIMLESEANGRIRVSNIAKNGLFAGSEIEIGDVVLSINGKRLAKGEGPEVLVNVIKNAESKVTVVVKKIGMAPRVPEKPKKDISKIRDNNIKQRDSYYAGQSKHKEDGSLAFGADAQSTSAAKPVIAYTFCANKEDQRSGDEIDNTAGLVFVVQQKLLFIAGIAKDSVFTATDLEVGDRVLSVNDCNFRGYADANLASKMVTKAVNAVTLIVEKGVEGFTPLPNLEAVVEESRSKTPTRRRRSRDGRRSTSASKRTSTTETKPLRRMLKNTDTKADATSDLESTDSVSGESFEDDIVAELGLPLSRSDYKEVVIAAPKAFSQQEVGVAFSSKKNRYIVVKSIEPTSIFANTSLEAGDIILEINDVDFRGVSDKMVAMKTCRKTKETVTMLVLKEDATFKKQEFNLDASSSNLEWQ